VLPTEIPDKGRVLTGISGFWFGRTREIVPNHLLGLRADGRSSECRRLEMLPLECVVRGYLAGSGWKDYQRSGKIAGHTLPPGLAESERLPEPIFTPSTKALVVTTRRSIAPGRRAGGEERYDQLEAVSLDLYRFAAAHAAERESCSPTPSSSSGSIQTAPRARRRALHTRLFALLAGGRLPPGGPQPSFDKQPVRRLDRGHGLGQGVPRPGAARGVVNSTRARYVEAFERLTEISFNDYLANPEVVLR